MVDKDLIQRLADKNIIDKKHLIWWQLGYEGRQILTEEEFNKGLETVSWKVEFDGKREEKAHDPVEKEFKIWTKETVPILLKTINLGGEIVNCFVSVKPISHDNGIRNLEIDKKYNCSLPVYETPHIRGLVVEQKDKFLFWYPFTYGFEIETYATHRLYHEEEKMSIIVNPISPERFYHNVIRRGWSDGKRNQTKAKKFCSEKEGFEIVPYYEFDSSKKHVTVYPVKLRNARLDFPVFFKSSEELGKIDIMGIGYAFLESNYPNSIFFWELPTHMKRNVRDTLKNSLGLDALLKTSKDLEKCVSGNKNEDYVLSKEREEILKSYKPGDDIPF
ncbi:MAG: hypothetical protein WC755_00280 [Candidatus Woesearchaeota archaeon]|jgi:hypothetical protein